jgi:hygromycin-B 4-O-kinase
MKYDKPKVSQSLIESILGSIFDYPFKNLQENPEGEIARTYSFNIDKKKYYIQFNQLNMSQGNKIELEYYKRLKALNIPVRTIVKHGVINKIHYTITEEVKGCELRKLSENEIKELLPLVYKALLNIAKLDISNTIGYGWIKSDGNGMFSSWKDHINFVTEEEPDDLFYGKWFDLFDNTFLDRSIYDHYSQKMKNLFDSLPEERYFQHGNFSLANILINNKEISAIIDWQDARYGDFLYDFTYFIFWLPDAFGDFILENFKENYESINPKIEHFYERIKCYKYYLGLDSLRFFAKTDQKADYDYILSILENNDKS